VCLLVLGAAFAAGRWSRGSDGAWATPASWKTWLGIAPRKSAAQTPPRAEQPVQPVPAAPVLTFYQELTAPLTPAPPATRPKPRSASPVAPASPATAGRDLRGGGDDARFTVQVGAYRTREAAEALQARLAASGQEAYITESQAPEGGIRFRVRVGSFASQEAALAAAAKLAAERRVSTYVTTR
jgi:cell division protein FtsN